MKSVPIDLKVVDGHPLLGMSMLDQLAAFVVGPKYEALSDAAIDQTKIRIMDALACAMGALGGQPTKRIREQISEFGGAALLGEVPLHMLSSITRRSPMNLYHRKRGRRGP